MSELQAIFIANLKQYRKEVGFSQAKLAELCEVSTGTIGSIENGTNKPSFDLIEKIAATLGIPAEYLFKGTDISPQLKFKSEQLTEIEKHLRQNTESMITALLTELNTYC